ncbi:TetR family transcriptional regulator [Rhizobium sp. PP-F2F-G48]|nr:TetR family transcriptional regulator [Rhizobium sp. PP-F2F-G48]
MEPSLADVIEMQKKRGRPRLFDVDTALDSAVDVFWEKGYDGTDIDALTEAMGINRPSLYAAYGNKRALFFKAVGRYYEQIAMRGLPRANAEDLEQPSLRDVIVGFLYDHEQPRGCLIACVLAAEANASDDAKAVLRDLVDREQRRIETWASERIASDPGGAKARCYANLMIATLHSVGVKASAGFPRERVEAEIDDTMRVLDGILKG